MRRLASSVAFVLALVVALPAFAADTFVIDELYSNADGTVQFVLLRESQGMDGGNLLRGHTLTATRPGVVHSFTFPSDLPGTATAGRSVLLATQGFVALNLLAPDYVLPDRFLPADGGTLDYGGVDRFAYGPLPADGANALFRNGTATTNVAIDFAGASASAPARPVTAVEFHDAALDHYFLSDLEPDIDALDTGRFAGWVRTGLGFPVYPDAQIVGSTASPVCRFYIPPQHGDSHFFSASPAECAAVLGRIGTDPNYSGYVLETSAAFYVRLPDPASGTCPSGTVPVYRLWNARADSNHRYTTDPAVKAQMVARGYVAEGYGPDAVAMCVPPPVDAGTVRVSGLSPFPPRCDGVAPTGALHAGAEVEPMIARDPRDAQHLIGVWQQDRWSDGGARGLLTGVSADGGRTWSASFAPFTRCTGGNAGNGADFARASDPWVTIAPDGTAYQIAIAFSGQSLAPGSNGAVMVSRSTDGGRTWGAATALIRDGATAFDDKESITADPSDARFVYATWDRLTGTRGPTYFTRTTDGGATWEPARIAFDPGARAQTIDNQIVVLPDGTLVLYFTQLDVGTTGAALATLKLIRSQDRGVTWSAPVTVAPAQAIGVRDPDTNAHVRDAQNLPSIAVGRNGVLALVWQDARFTAGERDQIAFSRSQDGGLTWSDPVRVNADPSVQAFVPTVHVRDDGTFGVSYYDFRSNTSDPLTLPTDRWLARSTDGITWSDAHVSGPFDLALAPNAEGLFLGDYQALTSVGTQFVSFHAQTNPDTGNPTDIVAASGPQLAAKRATLYTAAGAPALVPEGEIAARLDASVRRTLAWRLMR